ncbi:hypothetical protein [Roseiconus lacunae]|uniref:hypothetical protein n=1 Tax=Roseiconus lacunae TaxID=2605694 RepID=UPI0011F307B2|nr:hypothetical protein [Roseiconus lacunae]
MLLFRDVAPLIVLSSLLLLMTLLMGPGNVADVRVQLIWFVFLLNGWFWSPVWQRSTSSVLTRFSAAMITSLALYSTLIAVLVVAEQRMTTALALWGILTVAGIWHRLRQLSSSQSAAWRITWPQSIIFMALIVVSVCLYQTPRSNDIRQFILQQQDMTFVGDLQVSSIGMDAMDVEQPMPRWRAHHYHLLSCVVSRASGVAVDQVLYRYLTIPMAFAVLVCLIRFTEVLALRKVGHGFCLLAIFGPVLIWFRNFNAFNYSFRLTNNFLLDKDFALFWLVPAVTALSLWWIRGRDRVLIPLVMLLPAVVKFHPMTVIYLLLVFPAVVACTWRSRRASRGRMILVMATMSGLFIVVLLLGDAQGNHQEIRKIILMDYWQSLQGRPLHYWVGFYNTIPSTGLPSDTLIYRDRWLVLRPSVIVGCGALLAMHLALLVLVVKQIVHKRKDSAARLSPVMVGGGVVMLILWGIWCATPLVLSRTPYLSGGYERLHWFAYPFAIVTVAVGIESIVPRSIRRIAQMLIVVFVLLSTLAVRFDFPMPFESLRGWNSVYEQRRAEVHSRQVKWQSISPERTLVDLRPSWLNSVDRVLLLDLAATQDYWLTKQGTYWPDCYVEAFAWDRRGDAFIEDRENFYHLLDRQPFSDPTEVSDLRRWLHSKRVTLVVDRRPGAADYLEQIDPAMTRVDGTTFRLSEIQETPLEKKAASAESIDVSAATP